MNRINQLFNTKNTNILSVYFTAGYPELHSSLTIMEALQDAGVDMIEAGIPFSDPLADGPVIQASSERALKNGMNLAFLFAELKTLREKISIPVLLMGYLNPVMQYGVEKFLRSCQESGIDGVIIPDLPLKEYIDEYESLFQRYGIHAVFLITPQTTEERIRLIDQHSHSFIYMVSSASTTGTKDNIQAHQTDYFSRIQHLKLKNPCLTGFGISSAQSFETACKYSSGAIIGSAFIKAIATQEQLPEKIKKFITSIRPAVNSTRA